MRRAPVEALEAVDRALGQKAEVAALLGVLPLGPLLDETDGHRLTLLPVLLCAALGLFDYWTG